MVTMEKLHSPNKSPFHQWLLESKHVQSVEKLEVPEVHKWWILAHKDHMTPIAKFVTTMVKEIMIKILLKANQYLLVTDKGTPKNTYLPSSPQVLVLIDRLAKRTPLEGVKEPTPIGQSRTYAAITKPPPETGPPYQYPPPIVETTQVTTSTASFTLTNTQQQMTSLIKKLTESQQKQTDKVLAQQQTQIQTIIST